MGAVANNAALRTADALYRRRKVANAVSLVLACLAAALGLLFLGWILWTLVAKGIGGIDLALFTQDTPPPMSAGGLRNAFFGSAVMRSEEHTSELQSLMRISYAVFSLKTKKKTIRGLEFEALKQKLYYNKSMSTTS